MPEGPFCQIGAQLILYRFMLQHIQELHEHVLKTAGIKTRTKEWTEIKKRVSNQIVLRVISCIQIASKLTSHYKVCQINL